MSDEGSSTNGAEHRDYGGPMADQEMPGLFPIPFPNPMSATAKVVDTAYRKNEVSELRKDQEMRGDAPMSDQYYDGQKHEDLYDMVHENLDPHDATTAGDLINEIGNWLSDVSYLMRNAVKQEQVEWQGEAADKAHGLFSANADWAEGTRDAAWLVSNRYKDQAETASNARSNMPEPTGFDMGEEISKGVAKIASADFSGASDVFSDIPDKQDEADEKHAEAVQVMRDMDNGYHQTASTQPAFAKPPDPADSGSTSTSMAGYVSGESGGVTGPGGTGGGATAGGSATAGSGAGSSGGAGSTVSGAPSAGSGSYSGAGPVSSTSTNGNTGAPGSTSTGGTSSRGGAAAAPVGGGGNLRGVGSDQPRAGLSRGGAGGSGTPRSGSSSAAPRATGSGAGSGERSAAGRATGSEPGGSKGAVPRGGAAAARAAESSSGGGRPMAGAPGAGRGGGGGDEEEHQRKYEFGEDPDEIFGEEAEYTEDGHRIVPPVIGG